MEGNDMPAADHRKALLAQGVQPIYGEVLITGKEQPQQRMVASKDGEKKDH